MENETATHPIFQELPTSSPLPQDAPATTTAVEPPKKKRGRPRRAQASTEVPAKPPRKRRKKRGRPAGVTTAAVDRASNLSDLVVRVAGAVYNVPAAYQQPLFDCVKILEAARADSRAPVAAALAQIFQ